MYRTILIPLDGSAFAERALPLAVDIARRAGAALRLVRVHELYALKDPACAWCPFDHAEDAQLKDQERAYLEETAHKLVEGSSPSATYAVPLGLTADAILGEAQAARADLIVMTTHGRGPWSRFWLGSVADELIRRAPMPVLLLPAREAASPSTVDPAPRHMLIPLDGSSLAEQVLEPALGLGKLLDASYTLLQVVPAPVVALLPPAGEGLSAFDRPLADPRRREAQDYLDRVAQRLRPQGGSIQTRVAVGTSPAAAILEEARSQAVDSIALATHGRGGIKRALLGSVADKVLRAACIPLLVYRPLEK